MAAYVGAFAVVTGGTGCGYSVATNAAPAVVEEAWVIVHNESDLDVEVFLWDGWARATLLGSLTALDTANFTVPQAVLAAAGPYHLEARSVKGGLSPAQSESFALRAGHRITWAIPPADAVGAAVDDAGSDSLPTPHDTASVPPPPASSPGP